MSVRCPGQWPVTNPVILGTAAATGRVPGTVLGMDGKTYPSRLDAETRTFLIGRVHYLSHAERLSTRQIIYRLSTDHSVRRSVGWVSGVLRSHRCSRCVQVSDFGTPEHLGNGGAR